jgi:eukaryotic-like serine/threonine-protein kinase
MKSSTASALPSPGPSLVNKLVPAGAVLAPGMLIAGRYRLERYLARGGMAEVWAAQHEGLRSEVAIKFVDATLTNDATTAPYALERFRFESQISAKISAKTRHVVAVHDAGEENGTPYLVMELVNGRTLEDEIEGRGAMTPARYADVLDQVADALEAAHALGIVHRDLKPSNLMLIDQPGGGFLVKVADFGVAKSLRADIALDRPRETAHGELVGSPAFMSPEQIVGDMKLDGRSDLWSLGVVTYEALTGGPCFGGANVPELMMSIGKGLYRPASQLRADLPRGIDNFFARVFAPRPDDRFPTARAFAAAFRSLIEPRRSSPVGLFVGVGALVVLGAALAAFFALRQPEVASTKAPAPPLSGAQLLAPPASDPPVPSVEASSLSISSASSPRTPTSPPLPRVNVTASAALPPPVVSASPPASAPPTPLPAKSSAPRKRIDPSEIQ